MSNEYIINPKNHKKNNSLILFLSLFGFIWLVGLVLSIRKLLLEFSLTGLFFLFLSSAIVVFILFVLFGINREQYIIVEDDYLFIRDKRFAWANRTIQKKDLLALLLEYAGAGASLMFVYRKEGRPDIVPIAPFIGLEGKIELQQDITKFLKKHGLKLEVVNKTK